MQPIRVLHVVGSMGVGGIQCLLMNLYRNIDKQKVQFDFLIHFKEGNDFVPEIELMGGRVYYIDSDAFEKKRWIKYCLFWKRFYSEHPEYKIVHGHLRSTSAVYLYYASRAGCQTIVHSHSTTNGYGISAVVKDALQYPTRYIADYFMGCSESANKWMFGDKISKSVRCKVLRNGIDFQKYHFNLAARTQKRKELGLLSNETVIVSVGRLAPAKNQKVLISAMSKIVKFRTDISLLLVGDGPLKEEYTRYARELGLVRQIYFLGSRRDIPEILSAADVFCMPSKNEGLGIAAIEAQASGITTLVSSAIPKETFISNYIFTISNDENWADAILHADICNVNNRGLVSPNADYDIRRISKDLQHFYCTL